MNAIRLAHVHKDATSTIGVASLNHEVRGNRATNLPTMIHKI